MLGLLWKKTGVLCKTHTINGPVHRRYFLDFSEIFAPMPREWLMGKAQIISTSAVEI